VVHIKIGTFLLMAAGIVATTASAAPPQLHLRQLSTFDNANGTYPETAPVVSFSGLLYGTTSFGGDNDDGVVYKVSPNGRIDVLHSFNGADGAHPYADLVVGPHGTMYGATTTGGDSDQGTVYSIAPNGDFELLHSFNFSDGSVPSSVLWLPDGNLYGTTESGGDFDEGTVFRMTPSGDLTTLHSFTREEGFVANGLVPDLAGNLWGATQYGGDAQEGTIYKIARDGSNFTLIYTFDGGARGGNVTQALIAGCDGAMYGTTAQGGTYNQGTLFRVSHSGQLRTLHSFGAGLEGGFPGGGSPIVLGPTCRFYGFTVGGGTLGGGTLYEADEFGNVRSSELKITCQKLCRATLSP
jgi:uncharacterized repeat protein (TIGR03803 family)